MKDNKNNGKISKEEEMEWRRNCRRPNSGRILLEMLKKGNRIWSAALGKKL